MKPLRFPGFLRSLKANEEMVKRILIVLMVFFIVFKSFSQQRDREHYIAFSTAVDVRNLIVGSKPTNNKSALDLLFQASVVCPSAVEINIGYESFKKINFDKYTIGVGYHFPLYGYLGNKQVKTILIPSIEPTLINRWGTWGGGLSYNQSSSHLSIGGNIAFRININENISLEYLFNALPRVDLNAKYPKESWHQKSTIAGVPVVGSNYFKVIYKIQRGL
jgi:hypothetical protein